MEQTLLLNATYEPINVCTVRRAVVLLLKEKLGPSLWQLPPNFSFDADRIEAPESRPGAVRY
jgi:uncharacterized protein YecE (DUF72 family)